MGAHLERARQLMEVRRYDLAEKELREELAREPHSASAHLLLGECLLKRKRIAEAQTELQEAIRLAPERAFAHYLLSFALDRQDLSYEAERAAREAVRLAPTCASYLGHLGFVSYRQDRYAEALEYADEGLRHDPEDMGCLNLSAIASATLGRFVVAHYLLQQALTHDPENEMTLANLGWLMQVQNLPDQAVRYYAESLRLDPTRTETQDGMARSQARAGQDEHQRVAAALAVTKHHVIARFMALPGLLALLVGIVLSGYLQPDNTMSLEDMASALVGVIFLTLLLLGFAAEIFGSLNESRLMELYGVSRQWKPEAMRSIRAHCVVPLLVAILALASFWLHLRVTFFLAGLLWLATFLYSMRSIVATRDAPRSHLMGYAFLVALIGLSGIAPLASQVMELDASLSSCAYASGFLFAMYLLGSYFIGLFLYAFALSPAKERGSAPGKQE
jgi:Flp pilus assembly protein TadD